MYKSYSNYKKPNYGSKPYYKPYNRPSFQRWGQRNTLNTEGYKINEMINLPEVRVIFDGENLGVMTSEKALQMAKEKELDLVLVAEKSVPPICKIIDFSKFKYQEAQKKHKAKTNAKQQELKQFRIGVSTSVNDTNTKVERARGFLKKKDKVKFILKFVGRENEYKELGYAKLKTVTDALSDVSKIVEEPKPMGNLLMVTLDPK